MSNLFAPYGVDPKVIARGYRIAFAITGAGVLASIIVGLRVIL